MTRSRQGVAVVPGQWGRYPAPRLVGLQLQQSCGVGLWHLAVLRQHAVGLQRSPAKQCGPDTKAWGHEAGQ
jgi:hypothetical protein